MSETIDPKDVERVARVLFARRMEPHDTWDDAVARSMRYHGEPHADHNVKRALGDAEAAIRAMQPAPLPVVRFKDGERDV
jgi:hypothetical protein